MRPANVLRQAMQACRSVTMKELMKARRANLFVAALWVVLSSETALAQDAATFNTSVGVIETPVIQTIDQNGVDLTTGMLRLRSPVLTMGSGDELFTFGLEWVGRAWRFIDLPSISRDDGKYFVNYDGQTYEFNGYSSGFSERKPIRGTSLNCAVQQPGNKVDFCIFVGRHGEVVHFDADLLLGPQSPDVGYESYGLGNLGLRQIVLYAPRHSSYFTQDAPISALTIAGFSPLGYGFDMIYNAPLKKMSLNGQSLTISTPNLSTSDSSDHYLLPQSVTQVITDDLGSQWKYYVNSDREIYRYDQPGGVASINYTYDGDHRVSTIVTADGTWDYDFDTSGNIRTVIVTAPNGRQTRVRSHKELGYVTEYAEGALGTSGERKTTYTYDANERLIQVTYPELNYDTFEYDARGNVTEKQSFPKPSSSGDPVLTWQAEYPLTCTDRVHCNSPTSMTDPEGRVTEFEYGTPQILSVIPSSGYATEYFDYGDPRPVTVKYPETGTQEQRREQRFTYTYGSVTHTSTCATTENCVGTADEVQTDRLLTKVPIYAAVSAYYDEHWTGWPLVRGGNMETFGESITADGETRLTCKQLDERGRVVSVTPPSAGLASCTSALVPPQPVTANAPEAGHAKSTPTYSQ